MSVSSVTVKHDDWTASVTDEKRTYTGTLIVQVSSRSDGPEVVVAGCTVSLGDTYALGNDSDSDAICTSLDPKPVGGTGKLWHVAVKYETQDGESESGQDVNGNPTNNPLEFRDEVEVNWNTYSVPVEKAIFREGFVGDALIKRPVDSEGPVHNSVFVPFDPPLERDMSRLVLRVTRYHAAFPIATAILYKDAINSDVFTVNKVPQQLGEFQVPKYAAKMRPITGVWTTVNDYDVWRTTYEVEIDFEYGWRPQVVDRGVCARAAAGDPNGRGGIISPSEIVEGVPQVRRMLDAEGFPIAEPVLLNGDGQPLADNEEPVYLTWSVYSRELPFDFLGIWNP